MAGLSLSILGPFQATLDDQPLVKFRTSKVQALLIYLATEASLAGTEASIPQRREALMALLWPDLPQKSAQVNLRQTLYQLRQAIPKIEPKSGREPIPFLLSDRQTVQLNPSADIQLDVARFTALLSDDATPARLSEAVALYRDDFLCDFFLPDSAEFEDWATARRAELRRQLLDALDTLISLHIDREDFDQVQTYAWRALEIEDLRESAHRGLMTALAASGQRTAALAQYQICHKRLRAELGVLPSTETTALYERIQADALHDARTRLPQPVPTQRGMPIFMFTDIEGSTPLWETHREAMLPALLDHNRILEEQVALHGGRILELRGDGVKAVFEGVDPLPCVLAIQQAFGGHDWGAVGAIRIRIGLHGVPPDTEGSAYFVRGEQYYGPALHHAARVMEAGHGGQILVSQSVRNSFPLPPGASWHDLGAHTLKGVEETQSIFGLLHPDLPLQAFPPLRTLSQLAKVPSAEEEERAAPRHNLPPQPTPFIGREQELADLERLIAGPAERDASSPAARLVTITGPGGMGKTRLALAAADRLLDAERPAQLFPDGIFFVDLTPLSVTDHIIPALAEALKFRFNSGAEETRTPREQILDYLRTKRVLLIMDNFDHLLALPADRTPAASVPPTGGDDMWGVDLVADLLAVVPHVTILATSRERLSLQAEQVYPIQGLGCPHRETPEDVAGYTAARLFLGSARRARPGFELSTRDDAASFTRIARLVSGMPLALELAAGWVDVLSLAEIADEIARGLDFLETELRDVPDRHRGMRAVFDHSWERLDVAQQDVLARFSVFRGGCTRDAARKVTGASLRMLAVLSSKSLIQYRQADGRYQIHELLRQYAAEQLAQDPEKQTSARDAHSAFFLAALRGWEADLKSARQATATGEINADFENIRTGWAFALDHADRQESLRRLLLAADGLGEFYLATGRRQEGIATFERTAEEFQALHGPTPTSAAAARLLAKSVAWQAALNFATPLEWDYDEPQVNALRQSLALLSRADLVAADTRIDASFVRQQLGRILKYAERRDQVEEGRAHLETGLHLYRALGDIVGAADALYELSFFERAAGAPQRAREILSEALALQRRAGDPRRIARSLVASGEIYRDLQEYAKAGEQYEQAYVTSRAVGYLLGMQDARSFALYLAWFLGEFDQAADYADEALALSRQTGSLHSVALSLVNVGLTYAYQGRFSRAVDLFQEGMATYERLEERTPWTAVFHSFALVHAGRYEEGSVLAQALIDKASWVGNWAQRLLGWVALARDDDSAGLILTQRAAALGRFRSTHHPRENGAWSQAPLGLALHRLGRRAEAHEELYRALQTSAEMRAFLPLMHLIPVISVVLAGEEDARLEERAVELYALAESRPFVANSQLFKDIAGKQVAAAAATLPPDVVEAAQARDWWETAEKLLDELKALGWAGSQ